MKINRILLFPVCLGCLGLFSCQNSHQVNETEWKDAIESIVNYKDTKNHNYTTTGEMVAKGGGEEEIVYKNLEVNDTIEKIHITDNGYEKDTYNVEVKKARHYIEIYKDQGKSDFNYNFDVEPKRNFLTNLTDIYDNKKDFNFVDNHYVYKSEQTETSHFNVELTFDNKKITVFTLDYLFKEDGETVTLKGTLNFTYGNSTLEANEEILGPSYQTKIDEAYKKAAATLEDSEYTASLSTSSAACYIVINAGQNVGNKRKITSNSDSLFVSDTAHRFYKNNQLLTFGETEGTGDYWFTEAQSNDKYKSAVLKEPLSPNDKLEIDIANYNDEATYNLQFIEA